MYDSQWGKIAKIEIPGKEGGGGICTVSNHLSVVDTSHIYKKNLMKLSILFKKNDTKFGYEKNASWLHMVKSMRDTQR